MGSPDINYPQQPTYGEGMADAMEAQMRMLLGTGEFADIYADAGFEGADLAEILREVEGPLRQQTAQTDTDVLRTTLLGTEKQMKVQQDPNTGKFGIAGAEVVTDADGNPQTAGYGITLTEAGTVIYFSNGYDLEKRLQSEDRAHRIGQKKSVTYIDLIAPKTVDEKIRKALRKKINIATEIMGEELREWI